MNSKIEIENIVTSIQLKREIVLAEVNRIKSINTKNTYNEYDAGMWCIIIVGDALTKLKNLIENNFKYIETLSLIATTRYIFEVNVWLKLIELNQLYGLSYYEQLLKDKKSYWQNIKEQHEREITFLSHIGKEEDTLKSKEFKKLINLPEKDKINFTSELITNLNKMIDDKASRNFSLYIEEAKVNGYSFQSFLIEKNILPEIQESLDKVKQNYEKFKLEKKALGDKIPQLPRTMEEKARLINMKYEYDFIFRFTSSLLHATPSSLTTNQINLELHEVVMLLRYINIKIQDILDLVQAYK